MRVATSPRDDRITSAGRVSNEKSTRGGAVRWP